jgi:hypothetical protein
MGIEAVITPETIRNYRRLSYEYWYALAEFVDNSTQSYYSHRSALDPVIEAAGDRFQVRIAYERDSKLLRISDNAFGMDRETLERALVHGLPPEDTSGRHEFGMGLKTAACWIGNRWTIRTTALGEPDEFSIEYDVERVASGDLDLQERSRPVDASKHYTVLEIHDLNRSLAPKTIAKVKEYLRSIYRVDTGNGSVKLYWGDEPLEYADNLEFLQAADGSVFRKDFSFDVNGKTVTGWGGILESGGRPKAGFAQIRRGRLIKGQPEAWRPSSLFGQVHGSNDLVNQRLVGEIHLDEFSVSQQKDQILWDENEEDEVEAHLLDIFKEYRQTAQNRRKKGDGPSEVTVAAALDDVAAVLQSDGFVDRFVLEEIPSPEVVEYSQAQILNQARGRPGDKEMTIGDLRVKIFMSKELSVNDPYFAYESPGDSLLVIINASHPFFERNLDSHDSLLAYVLHCVYDALAEQKCANLTGEIRPDTVKRIKDSFLREPLVQQ